MAKNYWMLVSSAENFETTRAHGFTIQGIKKRHRKKAQAMQPGDRVLYYCTKVMGFAGTASITSEYFEDYAPIWASKKDGEDYPFRFHISAGESLPTGEFVKAESLLGQLQFIKKWPEKHWKLAFQGNVHLLPADDFERVEKAIAEKSRTLAGIS